MRSQAGGSCSSWKDQSHARVAPIGCRDHRACKRRRRTTRAVSRVAKLRSTLRHGRWKGRSTCMWFTNSAASHASRTPNKPPSSSWIPSTFSKWRSTCCLSSATQVQHYVNLVQMCHELAKFVDR